MRAAVVIPARDERARIGRCLAALAGQTCGRGTFAVVLVADRCRDDTVAVALAAARALGLTLMTIAGPGAGVGSARRAGMDLACRLLLTADGGESGLIAGTDADSAPAPDWLERQLAHVATGVQAIGGLIELDPGEAAALPVEVLELRHARAAARLRAVRRCEPDAAHHHFAGASLGVTAGAYRRVGGIEPRPALEDVAFARRLQRHGIALLRAADVRVSTSARLDGRAPRGLAHDLADLVRDADGGDQPAAASGSEPEASGSAASRS